MNAEIIDFSEDLMRLAVVGISCVSGNRGVIHRGA